MWAEIRYGDKTGWVKAKYLNIEQPSGAAKKQNNTTEPPENPKENDEEKTKSAPGTRYVGEKTVGMRAKAGLRGHTKDTIDYGQSVEYTGNSEILDGIKWAEVKYGNKTGWVIADYLKTQRSSDNV